MPKLRVLMIEYKDYEISDDPTIEELDVITRDIRDNDIPIPSKELFGQCPIVDGWIVEVPAEIIGKIKKFKNFYSINEYVRRPKTRECGLMNNLRFFKKD